MFYKRTISKYAGSQNEDVHTSSPRWMSDRRSNTSNTSFWRPIARRSTSFNLTLLSSLRMPPSSFSKFRNCVALADHLSTVATSLQNRMIEAREYWIATDIWYLRIYEYTSTIRFPRLVLIRENQVRLKDLFSHGPNLKVIDCRMNKIPFGVLLDFLAIGLFN